MKKFLLLILLFWIGTVGVLYAERKVESQVFETVREMMRQDGRVTFSDLYNSEQFNAEQKAFLGRLYEVFFSIPGYIRSEHQRTGQIPSKEDISRQFAISQASVGLLLTVLEADTRVPDLFERDPASGEISALHLEALDQFIRAKGDQVRMTDWRGQPVPEFHLKTFQGDLFSSEQLKGKVSLLYFWFSGCPPCVRMAPLLADLNQEYGNSDAFQIVGFNADEVLDVGTSLESRRKYIEKQGLFFVHLDLDASTRKQFGNVNVYPTSFFVNPEGKVVEHLVNFQDKATLEKTLKRLLN